MYIYVRLYQSSKVYSLPFQSDAANHAIRAAMLISSLCYFWLTRNNIQLLPLSEGDMTICSPEAGNIARGRSPRAI